MASAVPPAYVYVVVTSTDERKSAGTETVHTYGVFDTAEDANDEAKHLLLERYEGHIEPRFIERWTNDERNTIIYDEAGCLRMLGFPEEVCNKGFAFPFKVTVEIHELQRSTKSVMEKDGEGTVEEKVQCRNHSTSYGGGQTPIQKAETGGLELPSPPPLPQPTSQKRTIDDVGHTAAPPAKRPQIETPPRPSLPNTSTPSIPYSNTVAPPSFSTTYTPPTATTSTPSSAPTSTAKLMATPVLFETITLYELITTTSVEYGRVTQYGAEGEMEDSEVEVFLSKDNAIRALRDAVAEEKDESRHYDDEEEEEEEEYDELDYDQDGLPSYSFEQMERGEPMKHMEVKKREYTVIFRKGGKKGRYVEVLQRLDVRDWDGSLAQYAKVVGPLKSGTGIGVRKGQNGDETGSVLDPVVIN